MDSINDLLGKQLATAIETKNGVDAARVLDEAGACGWSEVFGAAKKSGGAVNEAVLGASGKSMAAGTETVYLYLSPNSFNSFATSTAKGCKR